MSGTSSERQRRGSGSRTKGESLRLESRDQDAATRVEVVMLYNLQARLRSFALRPGAGIRPALVDQFAQISAPSSAAMASCSDAAGFLNVGRLMWWWLKGGSAGLQPVRLTQLVDDRACRKVPASRHGGVTARHNHEAAAARIRAKPIVSASVGRSRDQHRLETPTAGVRANRARQWRRQALDDGEPQDVGEAYSDQAVKSTQRGLHEPMRHRHVLKYQQADRKDDGADGDLQAGR